MHELRAGGISFRNKLFRRQFSKGTNVQQSATHLNVLCLRANNILSILLRKTRNWFRVISLQFKVLEVRNEIYLFELLWKVMVVNCN